MIKTLRTWLRRAPWTALLALSPIVSIVCMGAVPQARGAQQPVFKSSVELVNIDVTVIDNTGHAVRGLHANDFVLRDRTRPQTIAHFDEISYDRPPAGSPEAAPVVPPTIPLDVGSNTAVQADRIVMLVVDDLHIWKGRTDTAKDIARSVITDVGAQASMAVIFTSGDGNTPVTADRSRLLQAIDGMRGRQLVRRPHQANDDQHVKIDPEAEGTANLDRMDAAARVDGQDFHDNLQQLQTLKDAAQLLATKVHRRKSFVMISEGFAKDVSGLFDASATPCELGTDAGQCYHDRMFHDAMEAMRRADVTTYMIDPRGKVRAEDMMLESFPPPDCGVCSQAAQLKGGGSAATGGAQDADRSANPEDSQFRWDNPVRMAQDSLTKTAEASGGFAVTDTNDFTTGLAQIVEDLDHYYLLGFYPNDTARGSHGYRPVDVTVPGHPDWTVHYRHGYVPGAADAALSHNSDPLVDLASSVMPSSDLPMRLSALPLVAAGKTMPVQVTLEITAPVASLKDADNKLRDDLSYALLVIDDKKSKVTQRTGRAARVALSARRPQAAQPDHVTYQIPIALDLAPGRYQLRASAISKKLDKGGSVYLDVTVPDFAQPTLQLGAIVLGYADGAHTAVSRAADATPGASPTTSAPTPMTSGAVLGSARAAGLRDSAPTPDAPATTTPARPPFDVSLDRQFAGTDVLRAYVEVSRPKGTPVSLAITVNDVNGKPLLALDRAVTAADNGRVEFSLPALGPLGPGVYRLRVTAADGAHVAKSETAIVIR